ncbi:MAG: RidA family protein [Cypionkella sp.]|nr:RidA family protein [Cypionkella sp.]
MSKIEARLAELGVTLPDAPAPAANYVPWVISGRQVFSLLAQLKAATGGEIDRVVRLVKLVGFVNSTADFVDQPKVINGASDFMVAVLGDAGRHARSAVSAASLPFGVAVEIEAVFEIA